MESEHYLIDAGGYMALTNKGTELKDLVTCSDGDYMPEVIKADIERWDLIARWHKNKPMMKHDEIFTLGSVCMPCTASSYCTHCIVEQYTGKLCWKMEVWNQYKGAETNLDKWQYACELRDQAKGWLKQYLAETEAEAVLA